MQIPFNESMKKILLFLCLIFSLNANAKAKAIFLECEGVRRICTQYKSGIQCNAPKTWTFVLTYEGKSVLNDEGSFLTFNNVCQEREDKIICEDTVKKHSSSNELMVVTERSQTINRATGALLAEVYLFLSDSHPDFVNKGIKTYTFNNQAQCTPRANKRLF